MCLSTVDFDVIPSSQSTIFANLVAFITQDLVSTPIIWCFSVCFLCVTLFQFYCDCVFVCILVLKILVFYASIFFLCISFELQHIFVGFELVGILSFRLIGHYSARLSASRGAIIALGINRTGDLLILCLICLISMQCADRGLNNLCFLCLLACGIKSVSFLSFL